MRSQGWSVITLMGIGLSSAGLNDLWHPSKKVKNEGGIYKLKTYTNSYELYTLLLGCFSIASVDDGTLRWMHKSLF